MFKVLFFRTANGECLILKELCRLPKQARAKAHVRIERLEQLGNQLKRPEAAPLRDGVYELRWRFIKVQYRLLYFFSGEQVVVLSHIITKETSIPSEEISKCIYHKSLFENDPDKYTYVQD